MLKVNSNGEEEAGDDMGDMDDEGEEMMDEVKDDDRKMKRRHGRSSINWIW